MAAADHELLAAARTGDSRSIDALLARHERRIFRFGLRMCGNEEEAREVLRETLLAAFRGLHAFRGDAQLPPGFQIACFCLGRRCSPAGLPTSVARRTEARTIPSANAAPDAQAQAREIGKLLQASILSLSENQREVLVLRDVEGLTAEEAAEVVGIEVAALKSRLHRARLELRRRLVALLGPDGKFTGDSPCPELAEELAAYAAEEIDQSTCARIEEHLQRCGVPVRPVPPCSGPSPSAGKFPEARCRLRCAERCGPRCWPPRRDRRANGMRLFGTDLILLHPPSVYDFRKRAAEYGPISDVIFPRRPSRCIRLV
jgi:RNA polymerase sigma-70 factor (ECF subfamily)